MGYGKGNWPGRGPYSHLPPWQRPGHLYGRGACWYLYGAPNITQPPPTPQDEATILMQQKTAIEEQLKAMQQALEKIQTRLNEISK